MPCSCDKQSYLDAYDVDTAIEKAAHPDSSDHEIRRRVAEHFRPKYRYLKAASVVENTGGAGGEFTLIEGKMYYPQYGAYAEDLHVRQKILSEIRHDSSLYNAEDHETTLLIEQAFKEGATVVTTAFKLDGRNNRDVLEYRFDKVANTGIINIHNTAPDGVFHSFEKIKDIAREQFSQLHEISPEGNVFILTDANVKGEKVTQVLSAISRSTVRSVDQSYRVLDNHNNTKQHQFHAEYSINNAVRTAEYIGVKTAKDIKETAQSVRKYFERKKNQKGDTSRDKSRKEFGLKPVAEERKSMMHAEQVVIYKRLEKGKTEVIKPGQLKEKRKKIRKTKRMIKTVCATGSVPTATDGLSEFMNVKPLSEQTKIISHAKERKTEKREQKRLRKRQRHLQDTGELTTDKAVPIRIKQTNRERICTMKKSKDAKRIIEMKKRKKHEKLHGIIMEELYTDNPDKTVMLLLTIIKLSRKLHIFEKIASEKSVKRKIKKKKINPTSVSIGETLTKYNYGNIKKEQSKRKVEPVFSFTYTLALWLLFRMVYKETPLQLIKEEEREKLNILPESIREQKNKVENVPISSEATQWILLTIIWYLAMIREQGLSKHNNPKKIYKSSTPIKTKSTIGVRKKIQKYIPENFPYRGVIYAYST